MQARHDMGSALIVDLVAAALVVIMVAAATTAFGSVAHTAEITREAARTGAVTAARTGQEHLARQAATRIAAPGSSVSVSMTQDTVMATVASRVRLPHPALRWVQMTVRHTVDVPVAPYRSNRG